MRNAITSGFCVIGVAATITALTLAPLTFIATLIVCWVFYVFWAGSAVPPQKTVLDVDCIYRTIEAAVKAVAGVPRWVRRKMSRARTCMEPQSDGTHSEITYDWIGNEVGRRINLYPYGPGELHVPSAAKRGEIEFGTILYDWGTSSCSEVKFCGWIPGTENCSVLQSSGFLHWAELDHLHSIPRAPSLVEAIKTRRINNGRKLMAQIGGEWHTCTFERFIPRSGSWGDRAELQRDSDGFTFVTYIERLKWPPGQSWLDQIVQPAPGERLPRPETPEEEIDSGWIIPGDRLVVPSYTGRTDMYTQRCERERARDDHVTFVSDCGNGDPKACVAQKTTGQPPLFQYALDKKLLVWPDPEEKTDA